mmetsp:Transcript_35504/g.72633  ORF Transcript_35504/g.72633 Transcript_35504/m.72633 type:complete len:370 (-) Transcript_35504:127-1236(-)
MFAGLRVFMYLCAVGIGTTMLSWYHVVTITKNDYDNTMFAAPISQTESRFNQQLPPLNDDRTSNEVSVKSAATTSGLYEFLEPQNGTIKSISLLGERHCGTNWIYDHLGLCFNHTIPVRRSLSRYKHWFQHDDPKRIPQHSLAIAMFRSPVDWTWAVKEGPHHATDHQRLPWKEFVTKEWTMKRLPKDEEYKKQQDALGNGNGRICQEKFMYHEIRSCLTRPYPEGHFGKHNPEWFCNHQPFYEMKWNDPDGKPYANILDMRADKIRNFMEISTFSNVDGFWHYRYEGLLMTGTEELIQKVEAATGVKRHPTKCKISGPNAIKKKRRPMDPEFFDYMTDNVDWDAEALIGYHKPKFRAVEELNKMKKST